MTMNNLETGTPFYCDLYHLTMAASLVSGRETRRAENFGSFFPPLSV